MGTIYPTGERALTAALDFQWADARRSTAYAPHAPDVFYTGEAVNFAGLAGGEQFKLTRGSTAQSAVTVTVAVPGGGPGTKTLAELITDINAVFGIAAGKPTDFAFAWQGGIRLVDKTVGGNNGAIDVDDYVGASEAAKNALFNMVGLPQNLLRQQVSVGNTKRNVQIQTSADDNSVVSTNYLAITPEVKRIYVEVDAGTLASDADIGSAPRPLVAFAFSDGTARYEPGLCYLTNYAGPPSLLTPSPDFGAIVRLGGSIGSLLAFCPSLVTSSVFTLPGDPAVVLPSYTTRSGVYVDVPRSGMTRLYCLAPGCFPPTPGTPVRFGASVSVRAWGVG